MSIQLPEYTIQAKTKKPPKYFKVLFPLTVIGCLIIGYVINDFYSNSSIKTLLERNDVLETINTQNQDKIVQLETSVTLLKTEQKVRQQAIAEVQNDYKELIDELNALKSEINFYERLLSPNEENKGLRVFEASAIEISPDTYSMKVVLVQKIERAKEVSGRFEIVLTGQQNEKPKNLTISNSEQASYAFKYFYNISLGFSIPEGFKAEQLIVKLFPNNKKAKTVEYTVNWHSIIN